MGCCGRQTGNIVLSRGAGREEILCHQFGLRARGMRAWCLHKCRFYVAGLHLRSFPDVSSALQVADVLIGDLADCTQRVVHGYDFGRHLGIGLLYLKGDVLQIGDCNDYLIAAN